MTIKDLISHICGSKWPKHLPAVRNLGHEGILEAGWETSTAATAQTRIFDLLDDPVGTHRHDLFGLVPIASFHGSVEPGAFIVVQIGEDAILVGKISVSSHRHT
jgi:hypothetical protein